MINIHLKLPEFANQVIFNKLAYDETTKNEYISSQQNVISIASALKLDKGDSASVRQAEETVAEVLDTAVAFVKNKGRDKIIAMYPYIMLAEILLSYISGDTGVNLWDENAESYFKFRYLSEILRRDINGIL